ncbi:MAG: hypothetical protein VB859_12360, partial [Planctomycetaceae bacterium]
MSRCLVSLLLIPLVVAPAQAENWTRFRGFNGTGVSPLRGIPTTWSPGDYNFNVRLPGEGHGAAVIHGQKLFITSAVNKGAIRYLFCLNADSGEIHWSRPLGMNQSRKHLRNSWASST